MAIELEERGSVEVRRSVIPDDQDVEGAMLDVAGLPVEDTDFDPDLFELVATKRPGEDDACLWFG